MVPDTSDPEGVSTLGRYGQLGQAVEPPGLHRPPRGHGRGGADVELGEGVGAGGVWRHRARPGRGHKPAAGLPVQDHLPRRRGSLTGAPSPATPTAWPRSGDRARERRFWCAWATRPREARRERDWPRTPTRPAGPDRAGNGIVLRSRPGGLDHRQAVPAPGPVRDLLARRREHRRDQPHHGVNTTIDGKRVVEAYSYGTAYTDVDLKVSADTGNVASSSASVVRTWHDNPKTGKQVVTPDAEVQRIVDQANEAVAPIKNEVVGHADVDLTREQVPSAPPGGESNLGDVATDAMNWQADQLEGTVDFAFANSGGIRADIPAGDITRGEVIEAFPFQNVLATTTLTGAQVKEVLEQGASGQHGMVQVSGLRFTYDPSQPVGSRVTSITVSATDQPIDPSADYRVVTNDFMLSGGDNYTTFQQGANPVIYSDQLLSDAIVRYVQQSSQINQLIEGRIETQ